MSWSLFRWVWQLESPLSIGAGPAGSLNRCRLYVPSRAIWGAVTAALARQSTAEFPAYSEVGKEVRENCRFTYLYPAERIGEHYAVWLPQYVESAGLCWKMHKGPNEECISERAFKRRLIGARASTAIAPDTDTAADESLRETECILPYWRHTSELSSVFLVGYVFTRNDFDEKLKQLPKSLFLGGDTRYGLGKVTRVQDLEPAELEKVFDAEWPEKEKPIINTGHILGHAQSEVTVDIKGEQECLAGWNAGQLERVTHAEAPTLYWCPASWVNTISSWELTEDGYWKRVTP